MISTTQSNYENNYNAFQLSLPLDLGIKIDPDDEVVSFLKALEGECNPELKEEITYQRAKRKRQKEDIKAKLDQLPQIDINYTLEDEHQICPSCGSRLKKVGKKTDKKRIKLHSSKIGSSQHLPNDI